LHGQLLSFAGYVPLTNRSTRTGDFWIKIWRCLSGNRALRPLLALRGKYLVKTALDAAKLGLPARGRLGCLDWIKPSEGRSGQSVQEILDVPRAEFPAAGESRSAEPYPAPVGTLDSVDDPSRDGLGMNRAASGWGEMGRCLAE
jgi:hypothetical protein